MHIAGEIHENTLKTGLPLRTEAFFKYKTQGTCPHRLTWK
uniref:Uncharacterized protein n=1 Tax=Anguilla anguilla TaxID=7936 RepID=A0A0E9SGB2_ANGAN